MDIAEATAWLEGERSMVNSAPMNPPETWQDRIAEAELGGWREQKRTN